MTLEQLIYLNCEENYVTDGVDVYSVKFIVKFTELIEFTFTDIKSGVINDLIVFKNVGKYILQNPMKTGFLSRLYSKPKKEEPKMKIEFNMQPQTKAISYPRFMLHNSKEFVVLFFNYTSGVVVMSTNQVYKIHFFGTGFNMNDFTPVEGCSVTFSDKN